MMVALIVLLLGMLECSPTGCAPESWSSLFVIGMHRIDAE